MSGHHIIKFVSSSMVRKVMTALQNFSRNAIVNSKVTADRPANHIAEIHLALRRARESQLHHHLTITSIWPARERTLGYILIASRTVSAP